MEKRQPDQDERLKREVQRYYAARLGEGRGCCGPGAACTPVAIGNLGYAPGEVAGLPAAVTGGSLGCGNPLALAELRPGEVVVDIGAGAGLDCLLAARRVAPGGRVIGLDLTPEAIQRARENARLAGVSNVEFRLGDAESMPLEDASVDWVISNCVINLAPNKERVFREVARVLKPGGRISISDIVFADDLAELPAVLREDPALVAACVGGAVRESEYLAALAAAGLEQARVVDRTPYQTEVIEAYLADLAAALGGGERLAAFMKSLAAGAAGKVMAVRITARKPPAGGSSLQLEPARPEDAAAVLELLAAAGLPREGVEDHLDQFVVARAGSRVVGCAGLEVVGSSALLRSLVVAPEWRGKGVGRQLAESLLTRARQRGLAEAVVLTSTVQDWAVREGFERVPREAVSAELRSSGEFRLSQCANAVCLRLRLPGPP